jgi:hypothetical protein
MVAIQTKYEFDNVEFLQQALVCRGGKKEIELVTDIQRSLATKDGGTWCTHHGNFCLGTTKTSRMVLGIQHCIYILSKFDSPAITTVPAPAAESTNHSSVMVATGRPCENTHSSDAVIFIGSSLPASAGVAAAAVQFLHKAVVIVHDVFFPFHGCAGR